MTRLATILALALAFALCRPANAAGGCGDYELFRAALFKKYKEVPQDMGIAGHAVIILFLSPARSFTLVSRFGNGQACIIASGTEWFKSKPEIPGKNL